MRVDRPGTATPLRWGRALAWIAAWALVVAAGYFAPLWIAIALAIGVFGAQILLAPGCETACRTPAGVTEDSRPSAR
jgi:hypothetical protein